jgi:anaerobic dimethyl sulfoxide reductase subunit A
MPPGIPPGNSYRSYILGQGADRTAKTPQWAAAITGVPANTIVKFAREVAQAKPANITQGWGPQRHANGENQARAIYTLAALTGNIGIPGGGTGGREGYYWPVTKWFPDLDNPVQTSISCYGWTDAIVRGPQMTATADGVRGADRLTVGIKFMLSYGGNMLASQHGDLNRTREILVDDSLCEFICVVDNQMSPSAWLADLVLPDTTTSERWDLVPSEYTGDMAYLIMAEKAIEPLFDSKPAYEMCVEIARHAGSRPGGVGALDAGTDRRRAPRLSHLRRAAGVGRLPLHQPGRADRAAGGLPGRPGGQPVGHPVRQGRDLLLRTVGAGEAVDLRRPAARRRDHRPA